MIYFLKFILNHSLLIFSIMVVVFLLAAVAAALEAYLDFKKAPKEPMFWCHKHGYFREKHCLELFPGMNLRNEQGGKCLVCPTCFYESSVSESNEKVKQWTRSV